jgi:membrane protein implicated in regulation of membrane protease activity
MKKRDEPGFTKARTERARNAFFIFLYIWPLYVTPMLALLPCAYANLCIITTKIDVLVLILVSVVLSFVNYRWLKGRLSRTSHKKKRAPAKKGPSGFVKANLEHTRYSIHGWRYTWPAVLILLVGIIIGPAFAIWMEHFFLYHVTLLLVSIVINVIYYAWLMRNEHG